MLIDYFVENTWHDFNDSLSVKINQIISSSKGELSLQIQAFLGVPHAVNEVCLGLASTFAHKQAMAFVDTGNPILSSIAVDFAKKGYRVEKKSVGEVGEKEALSKWASEFQKDTLFVIYEKDNPVTGEIYDLAGFEEAMDSKKIFRIAVSHHSALTDPSAPWKKMADFEVSINPLSPTRAFVRSGTRSRLHSGGASSIARVLDWSSEDVDSWVSPLLEPNESDEKLILDFEKSMVEELGASQVLGDGAKRYFDRAVLAWDQIDGSALISEVEKVLLSRDLKFDSTKARGRFFESLSSCRWVGAKSMNWVSPTASANDINWARGVVIVSLAAIKELDKLVEIFGWAKKELLRRQTGE